MARFIGRVSTTIAAENNFSGAIAIRGEANLSLSGVWAGAACLQRSFDGGANWNDVKRYFGGKVSETIIAENNFSDPIAVQGEAKVSLLGTWAGVANLQRSLDAGLTWMDVKKYGVAKVSETIVAENNYSDAIEIQGKANISLSGNWVGLAWLQRSFDAGVTWLDVKRYVSNTEGIFEEVFEEVGYPVLYRVGVKTGAGFSGSLVAQISMGTAGPVEDTFKESGYPVLYRFGVKTGAGFSGSLAGQISNASDGAVEETFKEIGSDVLYRFGVKTGGGFSGSLVGQISF